MAGVEKIESMKKYKRARNDKGYAGYILVSATTAAISCFVVWFPSLVHTVKAPLRVLCLVVIPELWVIWQNPGFLFVVSNVIILTLAAKSGMLSSKSSNSGLDLYAEFIKRSESMPKYYYIVDETGDGRPDEAVARTGSHDHGKSTGEGASAAVIMSDEELNKRVEDFIANFNKQLRLQRQRPWSRGGL